MVVQADATAAQVLSTLKAAATRAFQMYERPLDEVRRWARDGTARGLWETQQVRAAVDSVLFDLGSFTPGYEREGWREELPHFVARP